MSVQTAANAWTCFDVTIEDKVAHIQLKRPEAFNTMIRAFWNELPAIIKDINDNALARCIVISSTGKHFSAGMDLSVFGGDITGRTEKLPQHIAAEAFLHHLRMLQDSFSCLDRARMPVIVAIQGGCIGGAVDMTSACDIRYASADAFFCIQEINIGMTADAGTFPRLCKLIPEGWIREMAYTGRRMPAQKAKEIGWVNEVFDTHAEMVAHALATAREIAAKSPLSVTGSKVMINHARDHKIDETLDYIALWQAGMFATGSDMAEALGAKNAKREPAFPELAALTHEM